MIPEVLEEYNEDHQFFDDAAMRRLYGWSGDDFPEEVVSRILQGEHPVKVFRQYRRISAPELARRVGLNESYLRDIESGSRKASSKLTLKIASILRVETAEIA